MKLAFAAALAVAAGVTAYHAQEKEISSVCWETQIHADFRK